MINELIEKYEEKIEINEEYKKSDRSYSVFYEEDIEKYAEFIKDLEELKQFLELEIEGINDNYEDMEFNDMSTIEFIKKIIGE